MNRFLLPFIVLLLASETARSEDLSICKLGWDATQAGNHLEAVALFQSCIENGNLAKTSLARTYRNMGIAYRRAKQPRQAIQAYDKAIALNPDDVWDDYINRGNAYDEAGDLELSLADYDRALELRPNYGEAYFNRGIAFENHGRLDQAKADFLRAYKVGLRTELLYERLQVYGLLE